MPKDRSSMYLAFAVVGAIVPYTQFVPWFLAHGLNVELFFQQLFANRISIFFALDLLLVALMLIQYMLTSASRHGIRHVWIPIAATCFIGVSCGLPLYLFLAERHARTGTTPVSAKEDAP